MLKFKSCSRDRPSNYTHTHTQRNTHTTGVVYPATVTNTTTKEEQTYVGLTETTFKTRYLNHTSSFRNKTKKHATELSKHIWKLKDSNTPYIINWKIIKKSQPYSNKTKRCNLCLSEKFIIIYHPELSSLNKRNELISACRHRKKYLLNHVTWSNLFNYSNTMGIERLIRVQKVAGSIPAGIH